MPIFYLHVNDTRLNEEDVKKELRKYVDDVEVMRAQRPSVIFHTENLFWAKTDMESMRFMDIAANLPIFNGVVLSVLPDSAFSAKKGE
jgi:acetolactate synthase small subunit